MTQNDEPQNDEPQNDDHRERLGRAASSLHDAAELIDDGDLQEQIQAEADTLDELSDRDRAPENQRLEEHHHTIKEFHSRAKRDARDHISRALDHVTTLEDEVGLGSR